MEATRSGWLVSLFIPRGTAVIEDLVMEVEDAVGTPIIAHELPDVFNGVEFRNIWPAAGGC